MHLFVNNFQDTRQFYECNFLVVHIFCRVMLWLVVNFTYYSARICLKYFPSPPNKTCNVLTVKSIYCFIVQYLVFDFQKQSVVRFLRNSEQKYKLSAQSLFQNVFTIILRYPAQLPEIFQFSLNVMCSVINDKLSDFYGHLLTV